MSDHVEPVPLLWTPDLVRRFWDYMSRLPELYFTNRNGDAIVTHAGRWLRGREHILDFGCGTGFLMDHLLAAGHRVTGLDFSPETVEGLRHRLAGRSGFEGAFLPEELMTRNRRFDAVVCCEVIEHLYDEELDRALRLIKSLCEPGAVVFFTTPNNEDLSASEVYCPVSNVVFHRWQHVRSWTPETLTERLTQHGFEVLHMRRVDFGSTWRRARRQHVKNLLKVLLGMEDRLPHLYCAARYGPRV